MNNSKLHHNNAIPTKQPKFGRKSRDLASAITLRPLEVHALYGIPKSTLSEYCTNPDESMRLDSLLIPGRRGRKGARYIDHAKLKAWLDRWRVAA